MATRTYHETEYTNTIAEVKKHIKKNQAERMLADVQGDFV